MRTFVDEPPLRRRSCRRSTTRWCPMTHSADRDRWTNRSPLREDGRWERPWNSPRVEFVVDGGHAVVAPGLSCTEEDERALERFLDNDPRIPDDMRLRIARPGARAPGFALIFELLGTGGPVTGAVEGRGLEAHRTMSAWHMLRGRLPLGHLPGISLGTVRLLCVADLGRRLGSLAGIELVWSDRIAEGSAGTWSRASGLYGILFARDGEVWEYLVDAKGHVVDFGSGSRVNGRR